jgi:hypothetical protein
VRHDQTDFGEPLFADAHAYPPAKNCSAGANVRLVAAFNRVRRSENLDDGRLGMLSSRSVREVR